MQRLSPLLAALVVLAAGFQAGPAAAACAQAPDGRCEHAFAQCHPPAGGHCLTSQHHFFGRLRYACSCARPGPQPIAGLGSPACRQNCSVASHTCDRGARTNAGRRACADRAAACNRRCD